MPGNPRSESPEQPCPETTVDLCANLSEKPVQNSLDASTHRCRMFINSNDTTTYRKIWTTVSGFESLPPSHILKFRRFA